MKTTASPASTISTDLSSSSLPELASIPGDTYAVKTELKAMGAIWDKSERIWRIDEGKLAQAHAIVEHQALSPTATTAGGGGGIDLDTLADPFEQEGDGPRYAMLSEQDGNLYAAKDALKAIGASWDKTNRAWKVREERAEYARAIVATVTDGPPNPKTAKRVPALKPVPLSSGEPIESVEFVEALPEQPDEVQPAPAASPKKTAVKGVVEKGTESTRETNATNATIATKVNEGESSPVQDGIMMDGMMLGGLWRRRGAEGKVYLSGWLSDTVEIRIVSNEQRVDENDPSHLMYLIPVNPLAAPKE